MVTFRTAGIDDTPLIEELAQEIFRTTYKGMLPPEQIDFMMEWMYSQKSLRKQILEERHIYHIAYYAGEPVGYLSLQQQGERLWHLQKIYLRSGVQGKSVGKKMFQKAVEYIKEHSPLPATMELNVNRNNVKAWQFYEHMGMCKTSRGDFHIGRGYYMNDYIMTMEISC